MGKSNDITPSYTDKEGKSLDLYFKEMPRFKKMPDDEEVRLAKLIKNGDKATAEIATQKLVDHNRSFVVSIAKQYQNRGVPFADLISAGNFGMMKAAKKFDVTRGFKFITYAHKYVRGAILLEIEEGRVISLPANIHGDLNRTRTEYSRLEQGLHRLPAVEEIATSLEIDEKDVIEMFEYDEKIVSLDTDIFKRGGDEFHPIIETIADVFYPPPDNESMKESLNYDILLTMKAILTYRERKILQLWYGLDGQKPMVTFEEISEYLNQNKEKEDDGDIGAGRVRQLKDRATEKMQNSKRGKSLLRKYL